MIKLVIKLLVSALAIWLTSQFFDNVTCEPWHVSIVVALVLGLINVFIKPIVKILSLPINILSLGLFSLVINGAMILLWPHTCHRPQSPPGRRRSPHRHSRRFGH